MDVERGFKTVLDQFKMPGSAMYVLFDENRTHLVGIERGLIPAGFRDSLHECGSSMQMQDKAIAAGGCFTMVPLSDFPEGGYIGAVFFEHDLSKDHMAERLIEVRGMMRWAAGEEETVNQYKLLYEITKKFYSSMDVNGVLREIVLALNDFYPSFDCRLLLSYENGNEEDLPVEYLDYGKNTDNPAASKAFLTGDIQFDVINNRRAVLYAPLRGRQGVYGVLQVKVPDMPAVPDPDIELIKLLAGTGGNALENAQLYQQSQRFIADLQLINKTSHQLNSNLRLSDTIHFMAEQIVGSFGSEEVGFVLFRPFAELEILKGSTPFFHRIESRRFLNEAACRLKENQEALFISDLLDQEMVEGAPFRSFMCIPMIQNGELQGMVIALHRNPYEFSFESFKLLQSLVHQSTLAFTNSILHEKLQRMVITDYLTDLHVRHYLDEQIQLSMNRDKFGCFILLDIDDFKAVNDTYGHQAGDRILVQVAGVIRENIREVDVAARWGGEELVVYLPGVSYDTGVQVAKRLVDRIGRGTRPRTTVSCGISSWDADTAGNSVETLFSRADKALYAAKKSGKNQVFHEEEQVGNVLLP